MAFTNDNEHQKTLSDSLIETADDLKDQMKTKK